MLFNSLSFALFLPVVFGLYWFFRPKFQNIILLIASYFFYANWDWRFLFLLIFSTALDYYSGIKIAEAPSPAAKKAWLWISIGINLGFLGFFKYYNFFVTSFASAIERSGFHVDPWTLNIILPIGISFYTFHGLSYVIDIYNNRIQPERNFIEYSVFVSFFPLLVAGPIERATHLLPQIKTPRVFNYTKAANGMRQILWGLFKKIVIADNCAGYVNSVFDQPDNQSGSTLALGAILFAFQIYGDFSGYSDIALGTARLFGMDLLRNFAFPYFSRDIAEFWRRWHMSLSSWFRDYLYIPLGGSKGGKWASVRNTFIVFIVSGFWHGANWTFLIWGTLHAFFFLPLLLLGRNRQNLDIVAKGKLFPSLQEWAGMIITFALTTFAWIFFRAEKTAHAIKYISGIFKRSLFSMPLSMPYELLLMTGFFVVIEWLGREDQFALEKITRPWATPLRWSFYLFVAALLFAWQGKSHTFIYFQF